MLKKSSPTSSNFLFIALDFDGTLFIRHKSVIPFPGSPPHAIGAVSDADTDAIKSAKELCVENNNNNINRNCCSVLATGRNLLSLCKTLGVESKHHPKDLQSHLFSDVPPTCSSGSISLPVDYVILGSGSLTVKWPSQEIVRTRAMSSAVAFRIAQRLVLGDIVADARWSETTEEQEEINHDEKSIARRTTRTAATPFSFFLLKGPPHMDQSVHFICEQDAADLRRLEESGFAERLRTYAETTTRVSRDDFLCSVSNDGDDDDDDGKHKHKNCRTPTKEQFFHDKYGRDGFSQFLISFGDRSDPLILAADELVSEAIHSDPAHGHSEDVSCKIRVSHTTSPINPRGVWLEIFPSDISKSSALDALEKELFKNNSKINEGENLDDSENKVFRLAVGNDHNDEDMLVWASESGVGYLVNGSPQILVDRNEGKITMLDSPCGLGVAEAIAKTLQVYKKK